MTTERPTKVFAKQPAWNSYAGVETASGIISSFIIPPHVEMLSRIFEPNSFGLTYVLMFTFRQVCF
jgi:hypothetical protein